MDSIILAHRFLASGWKELDTAFMVQRAVHADLRRSGEGTSQHALLKGIYYQLERAIVHIMAATKNLNRNRKDNPLPRIIWLPQKQYDEETGIATTPTQPDLPHFDTQEELYAYLKTLADEALKE